MSRLMTPIKHSLATALYALPSIGLAAGLPIHAGFDQRLALLTGLITCLLGAESHAAFWRGIDLR